MQTSSVSIQYHDMHPSDQTRDMVDDLIKEVQLEVPAGARVKATFCEADNLVKGMLQINSYGGPFFAVAVANNLNEVSLKLLEQMRRRIEKFKSKRHERETLRKLVPNVAPSV